jgi:hypothetical protein
VVDGNSTQYKKSTPLDVQYDNMDQYINGGNKTNTKTATRFLEVAALDMRH